MVTNQAGIDLIKRSEGCCLKAYKCPAGVWTIGYGHTEGVIPGTTIRQEQAERLLKCDLVEFERAMNAVIKTEITENQFSAIISLAYNCGSNAISKSTLIKKVNVRDFAGAAEEFLRWDKIAGVPNKGLHARRVAERELFLR